MKRLTILTATLASGAVLAAPASAEIVKAPTGAASKLKINASTNKTLKKHRVTVSSTGSARKSGSTFSLPYSLSRWDFAAREGDVVHFRKNTGLRFKRAGGPSIAMVHPRVIIDGRDNGYITALISNIRVKTFTFQRSTGTVTNTASMQRISGLKLKLTKASAVYLNKGLKRKVLRSYSQFGTLELNILKPATSHPGSGTPGTPGTPTPGASAPGQGTNPGGTATLGTGLLSALPIGGILGPIAPSVAVDVNGDGQPDTGVFALPLKSTTFNATTRTGTIALDGGLIVRANGQDIVRLDDPEIIIGTTSGGLYALVNGVRIKVGDIDLNALNVTVLDGTVTVSDLDVRAGALGLALPGLGLVPAGTQLLSLDLSLPQV